MLKRKLILGISITALALVMAMVGPLANAEGTNDQSNHNDHGDKDKCKNDQSNSDNNKQDDTKCHTDDDNRILSDTALINQLKTQIIKEIMATLPANTGNSGNPDSPNAVYTHLDVGTCTTDPATSVPQGWCPGQGKFEFFIPDSNITKYSVVTVTTVPPVNNPLTTGQCNEEAINYSPGPTQGFGIICNYAPPLGSGLNYIVFNPSQSWLDAHPIK